MRQQSGDASLLRRLNTAAILRILRSAGVATLTELAQAARVSRPTVEAIIDELLAEGWAEECGEEPGERQRGRPAKRYRFRASAGHVLGVSIGAYRLHAMAADLGGQIVLSRKMGVFPDMSADERMAEIARLVDECADELGLTTDRLAAVGVGTTGVVDGTGRVVKSTVLPGWTGLALQDELSRRIPAPVLVENDMRLAVLAEHWRGVAVGRGNVVYLFTGNRMALGLLIDGRPYRGAHAASGEIGEQPHGLWSVFGHVIDYAMAVEPGELRSPGQAAEFAFARAAEGDQRAAKAVEALAVSLAEGLVTVVNPLDPEMVVIGGSLSKGGALLVEPIQDYLDRVCLYPPEVVASRLGAESIVVGAVKLALNNADQLLFL
ncbi:ROK family transcriptional regulator [Thermoactinospora rubra]|uniref:ROK family transcriptional regulator n=1 Tax=Thermoactinospora rubra TaxID=1088767 RepID=UPI000A0FDBC8|nr:ROK family transcriptional regulator [Thermoactinospora rubra]